jgi:hypothetical protein
LIIIHQEPIEFVVHSFYGTHVMNVASWRAAYCLFPDITLWEGKMCLFSMDCRQELLAFDKYVGRGIGRLGLQKAVEQFEELTAVRRVGDSFSRKLGFSEVSLDGEDPEDRKRPLEEFEFKFHGSHLVKRYPGPVGKPESGPEQSDDSE